MNATSFGTHDRFRLVALGVVPTDVMNGAEGHCRLGFLVIVVVGQHPLGSARSASEMGWHKPIKW